MNQVLARNFNERLIMSLLLEHESMTRLELGQQSGLSAQTISVIVRVLERDNIIVKGEAVRGRIGPPTTPIRLNPNGAFSIGLHLDQTEIEAVLINFTGEVLIKRTATLPVLDVRSVEDLLTGVTGELLDELTADKKPYLTGIGVTLPAQFDLDTENGQAVLEYDFERALSHKTGLEVYIQNDITAAASAEMLFGAAKSIGELLYCYVSKDMKPRLILGGRIYSGTTSGSDNCSWDCWREVQALLRREAGMDEPKIAEWATQSARNLTVLVTELSKFASIPTVIFSSPASDGVMTAMERDVQKELATLSDVKATSLGSSTLAFGAASLPIQSKLKLES